MKPIYGFLWVMIIMMAFVGACSDSTEPVQDVTPPKIEILLGIYPVSNEYCPVAASYYINPRGSADNISSPENLRSRWDFNNDGIWDTEFKEVDSILGYFPIPIPQENWSVTCEMRDLAGNSVTKKESIQLPSWVPTVPDIVAGDISILPEASDPFSVSVDTLMAGEGFSIFLRRRDWVNEINASVTQRYFIDDVFVTESSGQVNYPYPNSCQSSGFQVSEGISELGAHEIRVEAILNGGIVESDLENNSVSRVVYVVE